MRIKTITFRRGKTINLGNYESARVDYEVGVELSPEDNYDAVQAKLKEEVERQFAKELAQITSGRRR